VKVLSGAQYHFDLSNAITFIGNRVWVANQGFELLDGAVRQLARRVQTQRGRGTQSKQRLSSGSGRRPGPAVPLVARE
jgi:hypothetical protein